MTNTEELDSIVVEWLNYRASLNTARQLQSAGLTVPATKMLDFKGTIDSLSRKILSAMGYQGNQVKAEAMGELLLNAAHNLKRQAEDKTWIW